MPRTVGVNFALALLLALFAPLALSVQTSRLQPRRATHAKLTPPQQIGLKILDQQVGTVKGLAPVMRTFALLDIARGYGKLDQHKSLATLHDAFQASQTIEDENDPSDGTKRELQAQVISQLVALDPNYCEQLVPQLASPARGAAISALVNLYTSKQQFAHAIALLNQLGDQEFPYLLAGKLMQALPPEMAAERQNLFVQALSNFSQHDHSSTPIMDNFGVFISRAWRGLPPDLVEQAIDETLKQARQSDIKAEITVGAQKGAASFSSIYEYTLFQLIPVLRALDSERADRLLEENRQLQSTVKQFPNGLQSLDPGRGTPESITFRSPDSGGSSADDRYREELQRRAQQILDDANKNPKQALAAAMSLPDFHDTRALALLGLAREIWKTSPGYAAKALDELMKIVPSMQLEITQSDLLSDAGDLYLKLGNTDVVKKVVDQGFKLAEKLYAADTDASDPNRAFKAEWPSVSVWHKFVSLAARISPQTALQAINNIPDPEIQSLETIALANSLLGAPPGPELVSMQSKGKNYQFSTAPPPQD